jgi:integrase/recombinase XerC
MGYKPSFQSAADEFLAWAEQSNKYAASTLRTYRYVYSRVARHYPGQTIGQVMTVEKVVGYLTARPVGEPGWRENSVDTHLRALRALSRWAVRRGYCDDLRDDLAENFRVQIRSHRVAHWLEDTELKEILQQCPAGVRGDRDAAIVKALVLTGLRVHELTALTFDDLDLRGATLHVARGKGNKERTVGLMPKAVQFFTAWRNRAVGELGALPKRLPVIPHLRPAQGVQGFDWGNGTLWWAKPNIRWDRPENAPPFTHVSKDTIEECVSMAGERAGIGGLAPHDLRRTFAGIMEGNGLPLQKIQRQLGHASPVTTQRYLDQSPRKQASAMAECDVAFEV